MANESEWVELAELAEMLNVPLARVRTAVSNLESINAVQVREKPGDKRYKQLNKASIPTVRKVVLGE